MEILVYSVSITLLLCMLSLPIYLLVKIKSKFKKGATVIYLLASLATLAVLITISAWWGAYSNELLLTHFGYDINGWNEVDRYKNVLPENLETVKWRYESMLGVGWPIKAMVGGALVTPYPLIVLGVNAIIQYFRKKA